VRVEIRLSLPQEAVSVPLARRAVASVLEQAGIDPDCLADVKVVLSEACTNVLDHATGSDGYQVRIAIEDYLLQISVTDSGGGFDQGSGRPAMPEPWADRGRGAALIASLVDGVNFDSVTTGGAAVHMVKHLYWTDGPPPWATDTAGA
jgi:serine/threonine-protein kinase RsbW